MSFFKLRLGWNMKYGTLLQRMPPSYDRLLSAYQSDLEDAASFGTAPPPQPECKLKLLAVVMKHLPLRPLDGSDYAEPRCKLCAGDGFGTVLGVFDSTSPSTFQYDPGTGSWGFKLAGMEALAGDFAIDVSVGDDGLFCFPMNSSQFGQGAFHFRPDDVDEERRYALPGDFVLELAFDVVRDAVVQAPAPVPTVALLASHHVVKPSQRAISDLVAAGVAPAEASFALQRAGNDVKRAAGYFLGQPVGSPSQPLASTDTSLIVENLEPNYTPVKPPRSARPKSDADVALSPFLRETIGHGLSSPVTPALAQQQPLEPQADINPSDMDAVLLSELGLLAKKDVHGLLASVRKLNLGGVVVAQAESSTTAPQTAAKASPPKASALQPKVVDAAAPEESSSEERVGDSDAYRAFFKALKMGVPAPAVKMRMAREGACPDVLDLGVDAPLSKAMALEAKLKAELAAKALAAAAQPSAPAVRRTRFRWEAIPEEKLRNRTTIWGAADQQHSAQALNTSDLEALFVETSLPPPPLPSQEQAPGAAVTAGGQAKQPSSVAVRSRLDPRRAQAVAIGVAKLKLTASQLIAALERFDEAVLTPTAVQVVQGCSLVPTVEEATLLRGETATLAPPDAFLRELARLPDAGSRVEAMAFVYVCDETMTATLSDIDQLAGACKQVRESAKLKALLHVVLVVGNRINGQEGAVRGFTLASLLKLSQTRSLNKSTSVLEYLVHFISKKTPEVFGVADELALVFKARKVQLAALSRQERDLKRGMDAVLRIPQLAAFSSKAVAKLSALEQRLHEARELFGSVIEYFGEDEQMASHDFFDRLASFLEALLRTKQAMDERDRRASRAQARAGATSRRRDASVGSQGSNGGLPSRPAPPPIQLPQPPPPPSSAANRMCDSAHPHLSAFLATLNDGSAPR